MLWAAVNPEHQLREYKFLTVGTGQQLPDGCREYIGTYQLYDGNIVLHVFIGD